MELELNENNVLFFIFWYLDAACKGKDGKGIDVDHDLVISLLWEIVEVLQDVLEELKLIVEVKLLLNGVVCTVKELACVVADLLIVRFLFFYLFYFNPLDLFSVYLHDFFLL